MDNLTPETIDTIRDLSIVAEGPKLPEGATVPYAVIPDGHHIENLDKLIFNDHQKTPERIRQNVGVLDPESFIEYWNLFSDENSRCFAFEPNISVKAILDYHGAKEGGPRWGQHTVTLTLRESEQWQTWTRKNNIKFTQAEFAEFLEQNAIDITRPDPASIIEMARDLQGTTEVEFGAGTRLQNGGMVFRYTESTKATVGGNQVAVPERFTLTIPVFVGGGPVELQGLLRYRVQAGHLVIFYTLVRPEEVRRQGFLIARDQIAAQLGIVIINGTAA